MDMDMNWYGYFVYRYILSISSWRFVRLSNAFLFPDPEPSIINILNGWSGIWGQFALCSFNFSSVTSSELMIFLLFCYISIFKFFISCLGGYYKHTILHPFIIISTQRKLKNFFSKNIIFSLLNLCCDFNINVWPFKNSLLLSFKLSAWTLFFSNSDLLLNNFYGLEI